MGIPYCDPEERGVRKHRLEKVRSLVERYLGDAYPSYDLLILKDDCAIFRSFSGYAELQPTERPIRANSMFDVASLTKVLVTSLVYAKLVEEGLVSLRQRVVDLVPEFRHTVAGANAAKEKVALWMLLSHTSGLPPWLPLHRVCRNRSEVFAEALKTFPSYEAGKEVVYSDVNYIILTYVAERVTGQRLDSLFDNLIAKPLNLRRSTFNPLERGFSRDDVVATEVVDWRGGTLIGVVHDENAFAMEGVSGHAGLFTTTEDSARVVGEILCAYRGRCDTLISRPTALAMLAPWACGESCYGLGWLIYEPGRGLSALTDYRHAQVAWHTGFTGTSILMAPRESLAVIFYTNRIHPTRANEKIREVRVLLHNAVLSSLD
ncbi:MAG: serine hydrolase [Sulfolobales archaeon]|nr:serine hydrolase [Sulfolobales archaeon]